MSAGGGGGRQRRQRRAAKVPGGSGAVLGAQLLRNSGVQGASQVIGNLMQLASVFVVAAFLGPAELGRYTLLLFLGALVTQVFGLPVKPGTIRRTFGGGDDDDDDDDAATEVSASPKHTLGTGLAWATILGLIAAGLVVALREPISDLLLGGDSDPQLVLFAGLLGGAGVVFKVASIVIWLERRPAAFLVADVSRPLLMLVITTALLASGAGLEGAIIGAAAGTAAGAAVAVVLLRGSIDPSVDPREIVQIILRGGRRVPIVMSFWTVQNADVFLLSRFVGDTDLGIYALASRLGFVVSFLPQGFRISLRPLRKSAVFQAVNEQYGPATARGQLLGYFGLVCITAVLVMVLLGEVLVSIAPPSYADAAPLIPLTAAAFVMPSLFRTVNQQTSWESKSRASFVLGVVGAALVFVAVTALLAPEIGIYAAPVAMLVGFGIPAAYFFLRCQLGDSPIAFPYREVGTAALVAAAIAGAFAALPPTNRVVELLLVLALLGLYGGLLFVLRVIPESHWPALARMAGGAIGGRADRINPRRGLRKLEPDVRAELHEALSVGLGPERLEEDGKRLVRVLRQVGEGAGMPVRKRSKRDDAIAPFLFSGEPTAVRNATMRALLSEGADAGDLRALEDLSEHLASAPPDAWEGRPGSESPRGRRRRAAGRRGRRALARAARGIVRRI